MSIYIFQRWSLIPRQQQQWIVTTASSIRLRKSTHLICSTHEVPKYHAYVLVNGVIFNTTETAMNGECFKNIDHQCSASSKSKEKPKSSLPAPAQCASIVWEFLKELAKRWMAFKISWIVRQRLLVKWRDILARRSRCPIELRSRLEHLEPRIFIESTERAYESFIWRCKISVQVEGGHSE